MPDPTYEEQASKMREAAAQRWPPATLEATRRLVADLERTQIPQALDVGGEAPDFTLPVAGAAGRQVTLAEAARSGPVVLSFYRGHW